VIAAVPVPVAVTNPVPAFILATAALLLLHTPPIVAEARADVLPLQILRLPVIAAGAAPTVRTSVVIQPVDRAYVILEVPGAIPKATPLAEPIVATEVLLLVQTPPAVAEPSIVELPAQVTRAPSIGEGSGVTVALRFTAHPVPNV
jgi:hypothetical protein